MGDPEFALVDEAYPYIAKRLLTDKSPRLQVRIIYIILTSGDVSHTRMFFSTRMQWGNKCASLCEL